jgi:hypothetical protein
MLQRRSLTLDDRFMGPAWAVTYPPGTREVMLGRHRHVTESHTLNQRCKEAAAAMCESCSIVLEAMRLLGGWADSARYQIVEAMAVHS